MREVILLGIAIAFLPGCQNPELCTKDWHTSPERNVMSSTIYLFAEWSAVQRLHPGMSTEDAERLIGPLQTYHHPVNAIVYSVHDGRTYEVALKISKDRKTVEDISYKLIEPATLPAKAGHDDETPSPLAGLTPATAPEGRLA